MAEQAEQTASTETKSTSGRRYVGLVVSDKGDKTIVVRIQNKIQHPMYKKFITRDKKLYAHDEQNDANIGDTVEVIEVSRKLSKMKRYTLTKIVERAK